MSDPVLPPLTFQQSIPPEAGPGAPVLVLLHGRGADGHDLQGLARHLPPGTVLLTPQAPWPGGPWGYGGGWAWYRYAGEDRVEGSTLAPSLEALHRFIEGIPELLSFNPGKILLGGFSQGGTLSLAYALRQAAAGVAPPPVLNLSGFLIDDPLVPVEPGAARLSLFWGHGQDDAAIPWALAQRGRDRLAAAGADQTIFDHAGGHQIEAAEWAAARSWIEAHS
jgi:phospholipase/carboxylesterase